MGFFGSIKSTANSFVDSTLTTVQTSKSIIVTGITAINYNLTISILNTFNDKYKTIPRLISCVEAINEEVVIHSKSESETKDDELIHGIINRIDVDVAIAELKPIVTLLPAGPVLIMILKAIANYNKK